MASADTAVDHLPQHTAMRAAFAGWLTPRYAHQVASAHAVASAGVEWSTWAAHRAYLLVTARLSGDDHPTDTDTVAARMVLVTEVPVGRDGWRGARSQSVVAVVLEKTDEKWRIDSDQPS